MKFIPTSVARKVSMTVLKTKKNSPTLLFAAGVVGFGATVVTASKATLRLEEVVQDLESGTALAEKNLELRPDSYSEKDLAHDVRVYRSQAALKIVKIYAVPAGLGVLSLVCFTQAHRIQAKRIAGLSAALAIVTESFERYRERVRDELGELKDREFLYGVEEHTIQEQTGDGLKKRKGKRPAELSGYARYFDEFNPCWQPTPSNNETFLRAHQEIANARLQSQGYLFLNDVYEALGFERTQAGQVVGWVRKNRGGKDGYVDFGLGSWPSPEDFSKGRERSILLDFNVDGEVLNLIGPEM